MACPNHKYFRLVEGALVCDACGQPPIVPTETTAGKAPAIKRKKG